MDDPTRHAGTADEDRTSPDATPTEWSSIRPDRAIGPYRLVQRLGEGGMGEVWLAEQTEPVKRRVALKIIKHGMDTAAVAARFETERQALAMMDHPGIARVFDAGATSSGRPYFVMEYVPGIPINRYCDDNRLSLAERLELFCDVCQAAQHAHQKGIIHRDLKPTNILVAASDGRPVAKIIDFGVAKATSQHLTERTHFTEIGQIIGTPEYMSPEQADPGGLDVDSRSDIYSLGVVLYELLAGVLPLDSQTLRGKGYAEIQRQIREVDPPRPSTRVTLASDVIAEAARLRRTDPRALVRHLSGDLDWITMKALEKDPARRYPSASEFGADIQRHLRNEPVLAARPSLAYRITKFTRRNRGLVAAASVAVAVLVLGLMGTTAMYLRAREAEYSARLAQDDAVRRSYQANLLAAKLSLDAHNLAEARRRLLACAPEKRGWEWRHLFLRCDTSTVRLGGVHPQVVTAFYDEAGSVITADSTNLAYWNTADGRPERVLEVTPLAGVNEDAAALGLVAASSDGSCAVVHAGYDREARINQFAVIALDGGARLMEITQGYPVPPAFGDGCRLLASFFAHSREKGSERIEILDPAAGETIRSIPWDRRRGDVSVLRFGPGAGRLAVGTVTGTVSVIEVDSGRTLATWRSGRHPVAGLALGQELLVIGASNGIASVYRPDGTPVIPPFTAHEAGLTAVALSPDETLFATGSEDQEARLWEVDGGDAAGTLIGSEASVTALDFHPGGRRILAGARDGVVREWGTPSQESVRAATTEEVVYSLARGASADLLVAGRGAVDVALLDASDRDIAPAGWDSPVAHLSPMAAGVSAFYSPDESMSVTADGRFVVRWSSGSELEVWDLMARRRKASVPRKESIGVSLAALSPVGDLLAAAGPRGSIQLWDWRAGKLLFGFNEDGKPARALTFTPDGRRLASAHVGSMGAIGGGVRIWNLETTALERELPTDGRAVGTLLFNPSGARLFGGASQEYQGSAPIAVWDVRRGTLEKDLEGHTLAVTSLDLSPDGTRLASGSSDGTVRIWDAVRLDPLLVLDDHREGVVSLSFTADGKRLVSSHGNRSIVVWGSRASPGDASHGED